MALMMEKLYDALRAAQVPDDKARAVVEALNRAAGAAESEAHYKRGVAHPPKAAAMRALIKKIADSVMDVEAGEI